MDILFQMYENGRILHEQGAAHFISFGILLVVSKSGRPMLRITVGAIDECRGKPARLALPV